MIEFNNITSKYSDTSGVFNLSFYVKKGEMVFLMGPTGSGKSTVLNVINKKNKIHSGALIINDQDVTNLKKHKIPYYRRDIGIVFQDYKLIPDRTVFENIALPLRLVGLSKKEIEYKVQKAFEGVGLKNNLYLFPEQLSGGEQQRVSIARALVKEPLLVLADEPTGNLDPNTADEILDIFDNVTAQGSTVLMSTHNYPLIKNRDKRFVELNEGRLVEH